MAFSGAFARAEECPHLHLINCFGVEFRFDRGRVLVLKSGFGVQEFGINPRCCTYMCQIKLSSQAKIRLTADLFSDLLPEPVAMPLMNQIKLDLGQLLMARVLAMFCGRSPLCRASGGQMGARD
jgi:hypothetical protein